TSCESVQSTAAALSAFGVRRFGQKAPSRARRQGVRLLDPIRRHVVLPIGPYRFPARDLQRLALLFGQVGALGHCQGSQQVHLVLRQRAPPGGALRGAVLYGTGALPLPATTGRAQARFPLQEQAALA